MTRKLRNDLLDYIDKNNEKIEKLIKMSDEELIEEHKKAKAIARKIKIPIQSNTWKFRVDSIYKMWKDNLAIEQRLKEKD